MIQSFFTPLSGGRWKPRIIQYNDRPLNTASCCCCFVLQVVCPNHPHPPLRKGTLKGRPGDRSQSQAKAQRRAQPLQRATPPPRNPHQTATKQAHNGNKMMHQKHVSDASTYRHRMPARSQSKGSHRATKPPPKATAPTPAKARRMEPAKEMRAWAFDLTAKCCEPPSTLPPLGWGRAHIRRVLKGPKSGGNNMRTIGELWHPSVPRV